MPFNTSMFALDPQVQIESPQNALAKLMERQSAQQNFELNGLKLDEARRGIADTNKLNQLYSGALSADGKLDRNKLLSGAATGGLGSKIPGLQKGFLDTDEAQGKVDAQKFKLASERHTIYTKTIGSLAQEPGLNKDMVLQAGQSLVQQGILTPELFQQSTANLPDDPSQLRARLSQGVKTQLTPEQIFTMFASKPEKIDNGQTISFLDNNPNSPTYGKATGGAPVQKYQTPDNVANNEATLSKPFEVTGQDSQPVLVRQDKQGNITPVEGYTPRQAVLKPIPASVNAAIIQNSESAKNIDRALSLLGGNDVAGMKGDTQATGWKGYLPNTLLNRVDPQGVDARAIISDIGSLKIHDRSGAAVTISESPRLMPFIPLATDDATTVKKKLNKLRIELASESGAMQDIYSKEQGYRPSPVSAPPRAETPKASPQANVAGMEAELRRRGLLK